MPECEIIKRSLSDEAKEKLIYIARHRRAFEQCVKHSPAVAKFDKCTQRYLLGHARDHDLDKAFAIARGAEPTVASAWHKRHAPHHLEYEARRPIDIACALVDYECSAVTKPDKPMSAARTVEVALGEYNPNYKSAKTMCEIYGFTDESHWAVYGESDYGSAQDLSEYLTDWSDDDALNEIIKDANRWGAANGQVVLAMMREINGDN